MQLLPYFYSLLKNSDTIQNMKENKYKYKLREIVLSL